MKKWRVILFCLPVYFLPINTKSQSQEAQQLLLNVEKLAQFKKILKDMYKAYKILYKGYTTIKDISQGNFNLHKAFLDGLLDVSPAVKRYKRIADIINYQARIIKDSKAAYRQSRRDKSFSIEEGRYLGKVYANLVNESKNNLEELLMVITAGKMRMSDEERLQAINKIYAKVEEQFSFLNDFNNSTKLLSLQRKSESIEINLSKRIYGY